MNLLLDTHIWLWSVGERKRLSPRVARELTDPTNQLWLSPISVWEVQLLHRKKRIELGELDAGTWVQRTLKNLQFNEAPLTIDVVLEVSKLSLPHDDPADLFLVATAKVLGLTLGTADKHLLKAEGVSILANR